MKLGHDGRKSWTRGFFIAFFVSASFSGSAVHAQQTAPPQAGKIPEVELAPRGERMVKAITYTAWEKNCFRSVNTRLVCRTAAIGTWDTGQIAVRIDLIEREGEPQKRLQLLLPAGLYLQPGAKVTVDKVASVRLPFTWCFSNTCVAAAVIDPSFVGQLDSGKEVSIEVVDSHVRTATTTLSLDRFATAHRGSPLRVYDQAIEAK